MNDSTRSVLHEVMVGIYTPVIPMTKMLQKMFRYSEHCLNPTMNKTESCINSTQ